MPSVTSPNLGLFLDRPPINIPSGGLRDGINFRCKNGTLESRNLGWERFGTFTLNGPVIMIDNFFPRGQDEKLIFGTATDIYLYDPGSEDVSFLTPNYDTGTASNNNTSVTGSGTLWSANVRAGDQIMFGTADYTGTTPSGNDSFTKVLLHMNGADASTTFTDTNAGGAAHTWTARGNAQVDTADKKFGTASLLLDGTGDWIDTPDHADFTIGANAFTVDMWFKIAGGDGAALDFAGQTDAGLTAAGSSWYIRRLSTGQIQFSVSNGTTIPSVSTTATYTTASNPGWHHLEAVRSGNNLYLFVDGVLGGFGAVFSGSVPDTATVVAIGQRGGIGVPFNGWLDEARISVGVARHTANFTPHGEEYYTQWYNISTVGGDTSITLSPGSGLTWDLQPYTIRKLFSPATPGNWSFDTFTNDGTSGDDLWFATNGIESVVTWNGTDPTVTLHPELGFICKTLAVFSNMMIYGNITQAGDLLPTTIINSDIGLPLNAGSTGTGISEQFLVHDNTDELFNLIPLGDYLIAYSARTVVPIQFVGDPLIFIFRTAITGYGPISPNALADFGDFHEFLGADAAYLFDGVTMKEVNSHVWRDILRQTDPIRRDQAFGHFDEEQGDLIWSIPNNADPGVGQAGEPPTIAWVEHYLEDGGPALNGDSPFSKRDFPFMSTGFYERKVGLAWEDVMEQWQEFNFAWNDQFFQAAFPLNLAGAFDGTIWTLNQTQTANGAPLPSYVRTGRMASSDAGRNRDLLTRIYPYAISLPYNLEVTLYMGDFIAGEPTPKGTALFDMNLVEGQHFVVFYRRGRIREYQFGSSAGDPWTLEGWDEDTVRGGRR